MSAKAIEELKISIKEQDDKRHAQNNVVQNQLSIFGERLVKMESAISEQASLMAVHTTTLLTLEKNDERIEKVVENNTKATNAQVIAFTELSASVKTGMKIAVFVVPVISTLLAYIANLLMAH